MSKGHIDSSHLRLVSYEILRPYKSLLESFVLCEILGFLFRIVVHSSLSVELYTICNRDSIEAHLFRSELKSEYLVWGKLQVMAINMDLGFFSWILLYVYNTDSNYFSMILHDYIYNYAKYFFSIYRILFCLPFLNDKRNIFAWNRTSSHY